MNHRYIAGALLVVALLLTCMGYLIAYRPDLLYICPLPYSDENSHCLDLNTLAGIVFPLMELKYILPLFLILFFIRPDVFKLWWKFAIPFGLLLFTITALHDPIGGMFENSRTEAVRFCSLWFATSSALLVAMKTWRPRWHSYYTIPGALIVSLAILIIVLPLV